MVAESINSFGTSLQLQFAFASQNPPWVGMSFHLPPTTTIIGPAEAKPQLN